MSEIGANHFISSNSFDPSWKKVLKVIFEQSNLEYKICIFFYASHCSLKGLVDGKSILRIATILRLSAYNSSVKMVVDISLHVL